MESQPQNPEFSINPENFHPCGVILLEQLKHDPPPLVGKRNLMKTHPTEWACSFIPKKMIICLQKLISFLCSLEVMHILQGPLSAFEKWYGHGTL